MAIVAVIALDLPGKALRATGAATGQAGFAVTGYQIVGLRNMDRRQVDAVVTDELHRAAAEAPIGSDKPAQALVDLDRIRGAAVRVLPLLADRARDTDDHPVNHQIAKVARFSWLKSQLLLTRTLPGVQALLDAGVDVPVLMPLPWGPDRRAVIEDTMRAAAGT